MYLLYKYFNGSISIGKSISISISNITSISIFISISNINMMNYST